MFGFWGGERSQPAPLFFLSDLKWTRTFDCSLKIWRTTQHWHKQLHFWRFSFQKTESNSQSLNRIKVGFLCHTWSSTWNGCHSWSTSLLLSARSSRTRAWANAPLVLLSVLLPTDTCLINSPCTGCLIGWHQPWSTGLVNWFRRKRLLLCSLKLFKFGYSHRESCDLQSGPCSLIIQTKNLKSHQDDLWGMKLLILHQQHNMLYLAKLQGTQITSLDNIWLKSWWRSQRVRWVT